MDILPIYLMMAVWEDEIIPNKHFLVRKGRFFRPSVRKMVRKLVREQCKNVVFDWLFYYIFFFSEYNCPDKNRKEVHIFSISMDSLNVEECFLFSIKASFFDVSMRNLIVFGINIFKKHIPIYRYVFFLLHYLFQCEQHCV